MRLVLWGDGESPHLSKWARALAPRVELWAASSRGFAEGFAAVVPVGRRLALDTTPDAAGGNAALLLHLPRFVSWLRRVRPDWIHAHYLTSHGTMAWLATRLLRAPGKLVGGTAPILSDAFTVYSNPLPHVLILTAIVVGVATLALGLALVVRIREAYGSIEEDDILGLDAGRTRAEQEAPE